MKIDWSGRSHTYSNKDINYLTKIIKTADPLTQGKFLKSFERAFSKYIGKEEANVPEGWEESLGPHTSRRRRYNECG